MVGNDILKIERGRGGSGLAGVRATTLAGVTTTRARVMNMAARVTRRPLLAMGRRNAVSRLLFLTLFLFAFLGGAKAEHPETYWPGFDYHGFESQSALFASIMIDGKPVYNTTENWDKLEVAAFVGDELRMTAMFLTDEYVIQYGDLFPSIDAQPIYYTTPGETVTFKMYNHATGVEYDVCEPVIWDGDGTTVPIITGEDYWQGLDDPNHPLMLNFISSEPATTTYKVTMKAGTKDADKWKAKAGEGELKALPLEGVAEGEKVTLQYEGRKRVMSVRATKKVVWDGDLSKLTGSEPEGYATATNGMTITGTLAAKVKVTIAAGATVTLSGVTISGTNDSKYEWAGLTCEGNATIILSGENTVKGFYKNYPGIHVPEGKTLTITGEGSLDAQSNGYGSGIGGGYEIACGDITIEGGSITATGGVYAAGIGSGFEASCGNILITGGTVEAEGGSGAAGIGSGSSYVENASCGDIRITGGTVKATGGYDAAGIGSGFEASCGNILITGGTVEAEGGVGAAGIGSGGTEKASCGDIRITGGTVEATGGNDAAGIGGGVDATCGDITITSSVTKVTATKGEYATYSIGKGGGPNAKCGTVTIGCKVGTDGKPVDGTGKEGMVETSPFTYWGVVVPLTMEALTDGTIKVVVDESESDNKVPTAGMQYAVNDGDKKDIYTTTEFNVKKGDRVTFYGNDTFTDCYHGTEISGGDAEVMVYGNIMSLVDETGFASANALSQEYAFHGLFRRNTTLKDASGLLLPATSLANFCYFCMFEGCSAMTTGPAELPAKTLTEGCYYGMFYGCEKLTAAPELPAKTLADDCYSAMFRECSELTAAPELPATELVEWCYNQMFYYCKKLASVTCLATSGFDKEKCLNYWLAGAGSGVTGTKTLYVDPSMTEASWNNFSFTVTAITP